MRKHSVYKLLHCARTVACARGELPDVDEDTKKEFLHMSDQVCSMREQLYPVSVRTPSQVRFLASSVIVVANTHIFIYRPVPGYSNSSMKP